MRRWLIRPVHYDLADGVEGRVSEVNSEVAGGVCVLRLPFCTCGAVNCGDGELTWFVALRGSEERFALEDVAAYGKGLAHGSVAYHKWFLAELVPGDVSAAASADCNGDRLVEISCIY